MIPCLRSAWQTLDFDLRGPLVIWTSQGHDEADEAKQVLLLQGLVACGMVTRRTAEVFK